MVVCNFLHNQHFEVYGLQESTKAITILPIDF